MTTRKTPTKGEGSTTPNAKRPPGRPKLEKPKEQLTLRLDADVVEALRASGKGWQGRVNEIVRAAVRPDSDEV